MTSKHLSIPTAFLRWALVPALLPALQAADIAKAPNTDDLSAATSWLGGVVPGPGDTAVFGADLTASSAYNLPASTEWLGLRLVGAPDGLTLNTFGLGEATIELLLGAGGIDASGATTGTTFTFDTPTLQLKTGTKQVWTVGDGANLRSWGPVRRGLGDLGTNGLGNGYSGGSWLHFNLGAGSSVTLESGTATYTGGSSANTIIPGATIGSGASLDFAALDSTRRVVPLHSLTALGIPNGAGVTTLSGTGLQSVPLLNTNTAAAPTMGTSSTLASIVNVVNQVQTNGTAVVTGLSLANGWIPQGLRFSVPRLGNVAGTLPNGDWTVNIPSGTVTMPTGFMVTAGVGTSNVVVNGTSTFLRIGNTPWLLSLHQHNTAGDLIINTANITSTHFANSSVLKTGPGRVIVTSTYGQAATGSPLGVGGGLAIHEGTYQVGNSGATGNLPLGTIRNQGSLVFARTGTLAVVNKIEGTGSVTASGSGEIQLSGASTYTGATNFNAGTLTMLGASALGSGPINFSGGRLLFGTGIAPDLSSRAITFVSGQSTIDVGSNNVEFASPIGGAGAGGLIKAGSGKLLLSAANDFSGGTLVSAGTLAVTNAAGSATGSGSLSIGASGVLTGTGSVAGTVSTVAGSKIIPGNSAVGTLTAGGLSLVPGAILDVELTAGVGGDKLVVTGSNGLSITGGSVRLFEVGTETPFSTPGTYTLIDFAGSVQGVGAASLSVSNSVPGYNYSFGVSGQSVVLTISLASSLTNWLSSTGGSWNTPGNWSAGVPDGNAIAQFTTELAAPSVVTLDGAHAVSGIIFGSANGYTLASGTPGASALTLSNGASSVGVSATHGSHQITAPVVLSSNLAATTETGASISLAGGISGSGTLVKSGGGRLDLSGANTFNGSVTATAGTLGVTGASSLGAGSALSLDGATLQFGPATAIDLSQRTFTIGANGATLDTNGNDVSFAGSIGNGGAGKFTKAGAGTLTLGGAGSFSGGLRVAGGTVSASAPTQLGSGALELDGGTLAFSASTTIASGQPVRLGSSGGTVSASTGSTVTLGSEVQDLVGATGALTLSGPGSFVLASSNLHTGGTTVTNGASATVSSGTAPFGTGSLTLNGGSLTIPASYVMDATPLSVSGSATLTAGSASSLGSISGSGTLSLSSAAAGQVVSFTGGHAGFSGTLQIGGSAFARFTGGTSIGSAGTVYSVGPGSTLVRRNTAGTIALGGLQGAGTLSGGQTTADTVNYQIGAANIDTLFSGPIIDGTTQAGLELTRPVKARITKLGTAALTLTGASTYTSTTTVSAGSLLVDGSIASTEPVTVEASGTLGGAGTIAGPVSLIGTLRTNPDGLRRGTLTLGSSLDLAALNPATSTVTSVTRFDFGGTTSHRVVGVSVAGTLTYGGQLDIAIPGTQFNGTYPLFTTTGAPAGAFSAIRVLGAADAEVAVLAETASGSGVFAATASGMTYTFTAATGSLAITGASVPAGIPAAPVLTATAADGSVSLSWTATGSAYTLFRSTTAGAGHTQVLATSATSHVDSGLTNGTTYYYYVIATNDAGTSPASAEVSATPSVVVTPRIELWRQSFFPGSTASSGLGADDADPDADGRPNLVEYAVNSNPTVGDRAPVLATSLDAGRTAVTFTRIDDPTLTYTVRIGTDVGVWSNLAPVAGTNPVPGFTGTNPAAVETDTVSLTDTTALGGGVTRRFVRLEVAY